MTEEQKRTVEHFEKSLLNVPITIIPALVIQQGFFVDNKVSVVLSTFEERGQAKSTAWLEAELPSPWLELDAKAVLGPSWCLPPPAPLNTVMGNQALKVATALLPGTPILPLRLKEKGTTCQYYRRSQVTLKGQVWNHKLQLTA